MHRKKFRNQALVLKNEDFGPQQRIPNGTRGSNIDGFRFAFNRRVHDFGGVGTYGVQLT